MAAAPGANSPSAAGGRTIATSSQQRFSGQALQSTMSLSRKRSRRATLKPSASKNDVRRVRASTSA